MNSKQSRRVGRELLLEGVFIRNRELNDEDRVRGGGQEVRIGLIWTQLHS